MKAQKLPCLRIGGSGLLSVSELRTEGLEVLQASMLVLQFADRFPLVEALSCHAWACGCQEASSDSHVWLICKQRGLVQHARTIRGTSHLSAFVSKHNLCALNLGSRKIRKARTCEPEARHACCQFITCVGHSGWSSLESRT